ncbi:MAG: hypothetical protein KAX15_07165 [Candidatus Omnitrophica bacterium]|nr:hypothetical protein [Candidatus Omnitrophota bacterium]
MKTLIDIIIFFLVLGYILKNISKIFSGVSKSDTVSNEEETVYRADADEIKEFLEKIDQKQQEPQITPFTPPVIKPKPEPYAPPRPKEVFTQTKEDFFIKPVQQQPAQEIVYPAKPDAYENPQKKGEPPATVVTPWETHPHNTKPVTAQPVFSTEQLRQGIIYSVILGPPRAKQSPRPHSLI